MAAPVRSGPALVALSLAVVVVGLDTTILNVALPTISASLGADTSQLQWIVDAYLLAVVAVMLPGGLIGDRFGRRRVLLVGLAVFLAGSVWAALSTSIGQLMAARAVQGLGAAVIVPLALALVATTFPPQGRARAMGILTAAVAAGLPLGPILGGVLLQHFTWSSVFWINVPLVTLAAFGCWRAVPESTSPHPVHLDAAGAALSTAALVALVYALVNAPAAGWLSVQTLVLLFLAAALVALFLVRLRRARHPLVDVGLFRDPRFTLGCVAVMGATGVLLAVLFVIPQYLQGVRGFDHLRVGLATLPMMLGLLIAGAASSRLQQRWGARVLITAAFAALAAGLVTCAAVGPTTSYVVLGAGLAVVGAGIGAAVAPAMDVAMSAAGDDHAGSASAVINTLRQLAGAIAVAVLGSVLSAVYAHAMAPAVTGLPAPLAGAATGSLAGAGTAADSLGAAGSQLRVASATAFATSMSWVLAASALGAAACGLLVAALLRQRAGTPPPAVEDEPIAAAAGGSH